MLRGTEGQALLSLPIRAIAISAILTFVAATIGAVIIGASSTLGVDLLYVPPVLGGLLMVMAPVLIRRGDGIEEVFLIHRSGLLLTHFSKTIKPEKDRDLLVAMLTAVQSFVHEAFTRGPGGELREMDFGEGKLVLCRGEMSSLAVLVHGRRTPIGLSRRVKRTLATVEGTFGEAILEWDGLAEDMAGADHLIAKGLFVGVYGFLEAAIRSTILRPIRSSITGVWALIRPTRGPEPMPAPEVHLYLSEPDARAAARALLERQELWTVGRQYRALMVTALQQIEEGSFSLPALANIYMTVAMQRDPGPKSYDWWNLVMRTARDVLRTWRWDPSSQAWVHGSAEERSLALDAPALIRTDLRDEEPPALEEIVPVESRGLPSRVAALVSADLLLPPGGRLRGIAELAWSILARV